MTNQPHVHGPDCNHDHDHHDHGHVHIRIAITLIRNLCATH